MKNCKILLLIVLVLPFCASGNTPIISEIVEADTSIVSKREYKALQYKGDELFKEGNYLSARKKYLAMKAVPGFENDVLATEKEELAMACYELANQANVLLTKGQAKEAQDLLERLLSINPKDTKARTKFGELWYDEGMKSFKSGNYAEAKASFIQSLEYSSGSKSNLINRYINSCNASIEKAKTEAAVAAQQKKTADKPTLSLQEEVLESIGEPVQKQIARQTEPIVKQTAPAKISSGNSFLLPKIGLGVLAVGAGLYANSLRSNFNSQVNEVNAMVGNTSSFLGYQAYAEAYRNAETYKNDKEGTAKLMLGVAAAAIIAEGALLMVRGKNNQMVSFSPDPVTTVKFNFILK